MKKDDQNVQPLRLDGQTLVDQLQTLASVGTDPRGGRTRLAASKEEGEGRDLLVEWMKELDLEVKVDSVGNIFGLLHGEEGGDGGSPLVLGSHIDTVLSAGPYDGCFGVLSALAVARAFGREPKKGPAEAVSVWPCENGTVSLFCSSNRSRRCRRRTGR